VPKQKHICEEFCTDSSKINVNEHKDFALNFQKSVLLALVEDGLLLQHQYDSCLKIFEKQSKENGNCE